MTQDFVRRLSDTGDSFERSLGIGDKVHLDFTIIILLSIISAYGLLVLYSAVYPNQSAVISQMMKIGFAVLVMVILAQISPIFYQRIAPWLFIAAIFLLVATYLFGTEVNGSRRWLRIPGFVGFQPSEVMKLALPMALASYFHDRHLPPRKRHIFWALIIIIIPTALVVPQPDLGTALIICVSGILVLLLAGIAWKFVFGALGFAVLSAPAVWFLLRDYQQRRILSLIDPERDPLGDGWNIIQSKTAIGSGGLSGKGLFEGTQSHLDFLPESQTDFIIAVLAEEMGFLGVVFLLVMYLLLMGRGIMIAIQAQDTFGRLLTGSITFTFFVYVFVNIAMVSGLLPVVGIPLPLVSYGGTSILTIFAGFGIMMSIHTHKRIML
ncbi:MAG: rod shape-determining protein RodA [Gammaproteobacteria bacterium]|nr:rod shape-determining protein RodA [Gammaproteobacteria bacterium]OUV67057.1 MAG: rod shape-determining protein RodA [Gammaproteobacteria bacterium TMED133]